MGFRSRDYLKHLGLKVAPEAATPTTSLVAQSVAAAVRRTQAQLQAQKALQAAPSPTLFGVATGQSPASQPYIPPTYGLALPAFQAPPAMPYAGTPTTDLVQQSIAKAVQATQQQVQSTDIGSGSVAAPPAGVTSGAAPLPGASSEYQAQAAATPGPGQIPTPQVLSAQGVAPISPQTEAGRYGAQAQLQPLPPPVASPGVDQGYGTGALAAAPQGQTSATVGSTDPLVQAAQAIAPVAKPIARAGQAAARFGTYEAVDETPSQVGRQIVDAAKTSLNAGESAAKSTSGAILEAGKQAVEHPIRAGQNAFADVTHSTVGHYIIDTWRNDIIGSAGAFIHHPTPSNALMLFGALIDPLNEPSGMNHNRLGQEIYDAATTGQTPGLKNPWFYIDASMETWSQDPKNRDAIESAYTNGVTIGNVQYPAGPQAVYALWFSENTGGPSIFGTIDRLMTSLGTDPTTIGLPLAQAAAIGTGAEAAARAAEEGANLSATTRALQATSHALSLPEEVFAAPFKAAGLLGKGVLSRSPEAIQALFRPTTEEVEKEAASAGSEALKKTATLDTEREAERPGSEYKPTPRIVNRMRVVDIGPERDFRVIKTDGGYQVQEAEVTTGPRGGQRFKYDAVGDPFPDERTAIEDAQARKATKDAATVSTESAATASAETPPAPPETPVEGATVAPAEAASPESGTTPPAAPPLSPADLTAPSDMSAPPDLTGAPEPTAPEEPIGGAEAETALPSVATPTIDYLQSTAPDVADEILKDPKVVQATVDKEAANGLTKLDRKVADGVYLAAVKQAAAERGIFIPDEVLSAGTAAMKDSTNILTREASIERAMTTPEQSIANQDLSKLHASHAIDNAPPDPKVIQGIRDGDLPGRKVAIQIPQETYDQLPAEAKAATTKVFTGTPKGVKGTFLYHSLSEDALAQLPEDVRNAIAEAFEQGQHAQFTRYQQIQEVRRILARGPGSSGAMSSLGVIDNPFSRIGKLLNDITTPDVEDRVAGVYTLPTDTTGLVRDLANTGKLAPDEITALMHKVTVKDTETTLMGAYDQFRAQGLSPEASATRVQKLLLDQTGLTGKSAAQSKQALRGLMRKYDTASQIYKENLQFNAVTGGRGVLSDTIFDSYTLALTDHGKSLVLMLNPEDIQTFMRAVKDTDPELLNQLRAVQILRDTGQELPREYIHGLHLARSDVTPEGEVGFERVGAPKAISRVFATKFYKTFRALADNTKRIAVYTDQTTKLMPESERAFDRALEQRAVKLGADPDVWRQQIQDAADTRIRAAGDTPTGRFSPADVKAGTGDQHLTDTWSNELSQTRSAAKAEVNRVLHSYQRTPIDNAISKVLFFHYWASRAMYLHADIALHNPLLLATYWKAWDLMDKEATANNYPSSIAGYIKLMGNSTNGFYGLFNPVGMVVPFVMFDQLGNTNNPIWERLGLFVNPFVQGALAAMGYTDNIPDVTGTYSIRNAIIATGNYMRSKGLLGSNMTLTDDFVNRMETNIIGMAHDALQRIGMPTKEFNPYDPRASQVQQLRTLIEQEAVSQYGPQSDWTADQLDNVQQAEALASTNHMEDNPLSAQAYKTYTGFQIEKTGLSDITPGGVRGVLQPQQQLRTDANAGYASLDAGGQPTSDQENAMATQSRVNAGSPQDLKLTTDQQEYQAIGTSQQQLLSQTWNQIAFPNPGDPPVTIGGRKYDLTNVTPDDRKLLADYWVQTVGGTAALADYKTQRTTFLDAHPEYQDFSNYTSGVYNYTGGPSKFRSDISAGNPNFARAMAQKEAQLRAQGTSAALIPQELDQWAASLAGYEAAQGYQGSISAPAPISVNAGGPFNPATQGTSTSSSSTGTTSNYRSAQNTLLQLQQDITTYQRSVAVINSQLAKFGVTGGLAALGPQAGPWIQATFGTTVPNPTALLSKYIAWMNSQPAGMDNSPQAFVDYLTKINAQQVAA